MKMRAIFRRRKFESEMDAELRFHIDSYTADLINSGMPEAEARRRARLEFGNLENKKEDCRASLGMRLWDELRADLRYGVRTLRQSPIFTAVAVISLALGIGANTAIFAVAKEVLYKTLGVPQAQQLRVVNWVKHPKSIPGSCWCEFSNTEAGEMMSSAFAYPVYLDMKNRLAGIEELVGFKEVSELNARTGDEAEAIRGQLISGNFYSVLGAKIIAGRSITEADDSRGAPPVAVISDAYWSRRFGRSAEAIGKTIRVNLMPVTIVGVNSPVFDGAMAGQKPDIFLPITLETDLDLGMKSDLIADRKFGWVSIIARLKPGVSSKAAQTITEAEFLQAMRAVFPERRTEQFPGLLLTAGHHGLDVATRRYSRPLYLLLTVAGLVLLMACVNLANLLLARSSARQRETSVRLALGAGRFRIFRQALTESMLIAFLGGFAGLAAGYAARNLIPALFNQSEAVDVTFDWRVLAFATGITLLTGFLFGIVPALRINSIGGVSVLKESARMSAGSARSLFGKALVTVQVSLSVLLLVGAGLFVQTLRNLQSVPLGFNPQHIIVFSLNPPRARYKGAQRVALFQQVEEKLAAIPGVQSATVSSMPLLAGMMSNVCVVGPNDKAADPRSEDYPWRNNVGAEFFETVGMPIIMGRSFSWHDNQSGPRVAVINRKLSDKLFPNSPAIGKTITACTAGSPPVEIVGVAANAKYAGVDEETPTAIYFPMAQQSEAYDVTFEVKTAANPESVVRFMRAAVASADSDLVMLGLGTQQEQIDSNLSEQRMLAALTGAFGAVALTLAGIGIFGIMAYTISRRTGEIGIRMALGAQPRGVLAMILREAWLLAAWGIAAGVAAALAATRLIRSELFGIQPNDPLTYCMAGFVLLVIALCAGGLPARRAARIDPCEALRHE